MARRAPREIVDLLGGFLRRNAPALSDADIQARMEELATGRVDTPDSTSPFVLSDVDASHAPDGAIVATELAAHDVRERLVQLSNYVVAQVRAGELPHIDLPDLHRANAVYDHRGNVFLGHGVRRLAFDRQGCKPFMRLLLALETASDNLRDGVCTTKRGLFYAHRAKLPDDGSQIDTDRALASLANVLRVRRRALGFVAARRGSVHGRLVLRHGSEVIDFARVGMAGGAIPRFEDDFEVVSSDAAVVVIIEKDAIAARLAEARWWDSARCIMVCGGGFPSMSTREFVRRLTDTLGIPAVIFADADPGGIQLALTYAHGSISTGLETPWLACNDLSWAGVWPSDIARHCRTNNLIRLSEEDHEAARALLAHPSRAYLNDRVREELAILVEGGHKVELDALIGGSSHAHFVDYMDHKLLDGDLIKL
jgi:DNA topoisomerase-6 subunit A